MIANATKSAVFRVDATAAIGAGHLMRCSSLADVLSESGWRCTFAGTDDLGLGQARNWISADGVRAEFPHGCDLAIIDSYDIDSVIEKQYRGWARKILVIDDLANRTHDCDWLLDQSPSRQAKDYDGLIARGSRLLLGADFALLRREFRLARRIDRDMDKSLRRPRVLVALGLSELGNLPLIVLEGLLAVPFDLDVDILAGSRWSCMAQLKAMAAGDTRKKLQLHIDRFEVSDLMAGADLAIGAGGTSAWERCCVGLPTLMVVIAGNQMENIRYVESIGAGRSLGQASDLSAVTVRETVAAWFSDPAVAVAQKRAALSVCDGLGAKRVASAMNSRTLPDGRELWLQRASPRHVQLLYEWQQDPGTRRFARNPAIPTWSEHSAWFGQTLEDEDHVTLYIAMLDMMPCGFIRYDRKKQSDMADYEVSIAVAPEMRGAGIGVAILALAHEIIDHGRLIAHVRPGNEASHALFRAAGYRPTGDGYEYIRS